MAQEARIVPAAFDQEWKCPAGSRFPTALSHIHGVGSGWRRMVKVQDRARGTDAPQIACADFPALPMFA
jgi:hypothetical protein